MLWPLPFLPRIFLSCNLQLALYTLQDGLARKSLLSLSTRLGISFLGAAPCLFHKLPKNFLFGLSNMQGNTGFSDKSSEILGCQCGGNT